MEGIIGTAGHIDHGKTTLIEALTGRNLDITKEELMRGITINLGFTHFDLDGERYGIIDVPGHEKLIKTMLTGVFGMDLILLVVAADDGIMPQTLEHLEILRYLKKDNILPVLTKCDCVSLERIKEVEEELIPFQLHTPVHFSKGQEPTEVLEGIKTHMKRVSTTGFVRYPIDRVFMKKGLGTILTGTLLSGTISVGDTLISIPGLKEVKVKGIEAHYEKRTHAEHGRVALQVKTSDELLRGHMLLEKHPKVVSKILDVKLDNPHGRTFYSLKEYHVHIYSSRFLVTLKLLGKSRTKEKQFFAQLLFQEDVFMEKGDLGILRTLNPLQTVAGVEVIRPLGEQISRKDTTYEELLKQSSMNESEKLLETLLYRNKFLSLEQLTEEIPTLKEVERSKFPTFLNVVFSKEYYLEVERNIKWTVKEYHKEHPYKLGIPLATLHQTILPSIELACFKELLDSLYYRVSDVVSLENFEITILKEHDIIKDRLLQRTTGFTPSKRSDLIRTKLDQEVLDAMVLSQRIVKIDDSIYLNVQTYQELVEKITDFLKKNISISIGQAKDLLLTTRSFVVPYLEYLDHAKITKRIPDGRILRS